MARLGGSRHSEQHGSRGHVLRNDVLLLLFLRFPRLPLPLLLTLFVVVVLCTVVVVVSVGSAGGGDVAVEVERAPRISTRAVVLPLLLALVLLLVPPSAVRCEGFVLLFALLVALRKTEMDDVRS